MLAAIRLHMPKRWKSSSSSGDGDDDAFRTKSAALIRGATAEMSAYYAAYFKLGQAAAHREAAAAVDAAVSGAFSLCE